MDGVVTLDSFDRNAHMYQPMPSPLREWLTTRLTGPRVLDVGCGSGFIGRSRPELSWTGIDTNSQACELAAPAYDAVVCGSATNLEDLSRLEGPFDEIVCCDVLEHFVDPASVLRDLSELLSLGGRLLVAIPNVAHWVVRTRLLLGRWDYTDEGPLDRTHLRFFTLRTAKSLLTAAGYRIEEIGYHISGPRGVRWARPALQGVPGLFSTHLLAVALSPSVTK